MFRETCVPWLVRISSLYLHKTSALHHTSALLRYNACSLCHRYGCLQYTVHFIKEIKRLLPQALLSYISTCKFLRTLKKCKKHLPSACAPPHYSRVLKNSRMLNNSTTHLAPFYFFNKVFTYHNFVYLLWTFRKENNKGFCVIDLLNEQHIVIIEESHDWPKYNLKWS